MLKYYKASKTILGINARNFNYTLPENPKEARTISDSKLRAKQVLRKVGIPLSTTYAVIRSKRELDEFDWSKLPSSFVLKPNKGFEGGGIIVLYGEKKRKNETDEREWIKANGQRLNKDFLYSHILNILEGNFSLGNVPDKAFFEERIKNIPEFKSYTYKGVPDVRVIVYNKIPVMAMLRLPTKESDGKANVNAGGVCVGIDMASGITTTPVQWNKIIEFHPDTKSRLSGIKIPFWDKILELAITAQQATGLGYLGADISLDRDLGPIMLEVNARPGLMIQIANNEGLEERLNRIKKLKVKTITRGIRVSKEVFGGEVEEEVETILGKKVIGLYEKLIIKDKKNKDYEVTSKIDTGAAYSSIDKELAIKLGYLDAIKFFEDFNLPKPNNRQEAKEIAAKYHEEISTHPDITSVVVIKSSSGVTLRPIIQFEYSIQGLIQTSKFTIIERESLTYPILIGHKDLSNFIIDPTKR